MSYRSEISFPTQVSDPDISGAHDTAASDKPSSWFDGQPHAAELDHLHLNPNNTDLSQPEIENANPLISASEGQERSPTPASPPGGRSSSVGTWKDENDSDYYEPESQTVDPTLTFLTTRSQSQESNSVEPEMSPPVDRMSSKRCTICSKLYDRVSRARDCAHRHRHGPRYKCDGRCGTPGCSNTFTLPENRKRHTKHPKSKSCPICKIIMRSQNIARHISNKHPTEGATPN